MTPFEQTIEDALADERITDDDAVTALSTAANRLADTVADAIAQSVADTVANVLGEFSAALMDQLDQLIRAIVADELKNRGML